MGHGSLGDFCEHAEDCLLQREAEVFFGEVQVFDAFVDDLALVDVSALEVVIGVLRGRDLFLDLLLERLVEDDQVFDVAEHA